MRTRVIGCAAIAALTLFGSGAAGGAAPSDPLTIDKKVLSLAAARQIVGSRSRSGTAASPRWR